MCSTKKCISFLIFQHTNGQFEKQKYYEKTKVFVWRGTSRVLMVRFSKLKLQYYPSRIVYVHEVGPTSLMRIFESILRICLSFIRLQITESYYTIFILQYLMLLFMLIYYWFVARSARIHIGTFKDIKINFWAWYYTLGYYTFTTFHI